MIEFDSATMLTFFRTAVVASLATSVTLSSTYAFVVRRIIGFALTVATVRTPTLTWVRSGVDRFSSLESMSIWAAEMLLLAPVTLALVEPPIVDR